MAVTLEQLEREAEEIRTNSLPSSNTAELVGQHLLHIKEYLTQIIVNLSDISRRSNKFLRLAVMIDSTNGILSIGGKRYKLIPTTDTPTWDLDYNDFVTKSASDNPEFSYVLVDSENKILFGVYKDGTKIDNSSMVEGETIGGFDLISIIKNYAATYNYD